MTNLNTIDQVKNFYSKLQFPGHYSDKQIDYHLPIPKNGYLKIIDQYLDHNQSILDVGCGTGLISNLFAKKYSTSNVVGVDFSDSVDYAVAFAQQHDINNVTFVKENFVNYDPGVKFDRIICQGVLHHMPDYHNMINKLKSMLNPNGLLIIGLYHPAGKILKKFININYKNRILEIDQEQNPYETSFDFAQVSKLCSGLELVDMWPKHQKWLFSIPTFFNYANGGLITYVWKKV